MGNISSAAPNVMVVGHRFGFVDFESILGTVRISAAPVSDRLFAASPLDGQTAKITPLLGVIFVRYVLTAADFTIGDHVTSAK
jgi:hypothetical protein